MTHKPEKKIMGFILTVTWWQQQSIPAATLPSCVEGYDSREPAHQLLSIYQQNCHKL